MTGEGPLVLPTVQGSASVKAPSMKAEIAQDFATLYTVPQAHWSTITTNQHETAVAGPESPGKFGICITG